MRLVLGSLLLVAAGLKAHLLWIDRSPVIGIFSSPRWQVAFIELEALLGLWLLTGIRPRGAWLAVAAAFVLFAAASFYLGVVGQPSCGCFGKVTINPWYTFAFDVLALSALWRWQPARSETAASDAGSPSLWPVVGVASGILIAGYATLASFNLSPSSAFALMRGEHLTVEPAVYELGAGVRGEVREFRIEVRNHADRPIRIIGGTVDCSCSVIDELPMVVPAREARTLRVTWQFGGRPRLFQETFRLYLDENAQRVLVARVAGEVIEPPDR